MRAALVAAALCACSFDPPGQCRIDADCTKGLSCASGICTGCTATSCQSWQACNEAHLCLNQAGRCTDASDCQPWQVCDGTHTCALAPGACNTGADCQAWETCNANNHCELQQGRCNTDADCANGAAVGPTCSASNTCMFTAGAGGDVLLWGTLAEGSCGLDALSRLDTPTQVLVGDDCSYYQTPAFLAPTGQMIYSDEIDASKIRRFVPDPWTRVTNNSGIAAGYPTNPLGNDPVLLTPALCPGGATGNHIYGFVMQAGTGDVVFRCPDGSYRDAAGNVRITTSDNVVAWTQGNYLLATDASGFAHLFSPTGAEIALSNTSFSASHYRTHGDAFWAVVFTNSPVSAQLWNIDSSGVVSQVGTYADAPSGFSSDQAGVIDSAGVLYTFGHDMSGPFIDVVLRRPLLPGVATVPYTEKGAPANDWSVYPPKVYNKIHISILVSTP